MKTKKIIGIVTAIIIESAAMFYTGRITAEETSDLVSAEAYGDLLDRFDFGDGTTYVIGHKSPDCDSVFSAIAMANLLNRIGIRAEARVAGTPDSATRYFLKKYGMETPPVLEDATGTQLWIVDHSQYIQAVNGASDARIVGITDHHGMGDMRSDEQIYVTCAMSGSTAAQVWKYYKDFGIEIDKDTAKVLLMGIVNDTSNMKSAVTVLDQEAYDELHPESGIRDTDILYGEMREEAFAFTGMTDREIFYSDYKEYDPGEYKYGIAYIKVKTPEEVDEMSARMEKILDEEAAASDNAILCCMVADDESSIQKVSFASRDPSLAAGFVETCVPSLESYVKTEGKVATFGSGITRKKLSPVISDFLCE